MEFDQQPFGEPEGAEFIDNPEPRCPVVLLLDRSYSMSGAKIDALNEGLRQFAEELSADSLAMKRVEVAIVTFGPVETATDFTPAAEFQPPRLTADGNTPMGEAVMRAVDLVQHRKGQYRAAGVDFYRPWLFLITDGASTDSISQARDRIAEGEKAKQFMFYSVGVEGADFRQLGDLSSVRTPLKLKGLAFRELFAWLSNSLGAVSRSQTSDQVSLENPTAPSGWAVAG